MLPPVVTRRSRPPHTVAASASTGIGSSIEELKIDAFVRTNQAGTQEVLLLADFLLPPLVTGGKHAAACVDWLTSRRVGRTAILANRGCFGCRPHLGPRGAARDIYLHRIDDRAPWCVVRRPCGKTTATPSTVE